MQNMKAIVLKRSLFAFYDHIAAEIMKQNH